MNIYVDGLDHLDEMYKDMKERNRRAKELRALGWTVKCETHHFYVMGSGSRYFLSASRAKEE